MRIAARLGLRSLAVRWSSTAGKPPTPQKPSREARSSDTQRRLRKEVVNIQIPIEQETEESRLQQLIEERRQEIKENNESEETPAQFKVYMWAVSAPKALAAAALIGFEVFYPELLPILHRFLLNYGHLTVFSLSGLDLAAVLIGHSLSLNTVKTTGKNWARLAYCVAPCMISTYMLATGYIQFSSMDYFLAVYIIGIIGRGVFAEELPRWLHKARMLFLLRCVVLMLLYRMYTMSKFDGELLAKPEYWPSFKPEKPADTLKLSEIK